MKNIGKNAIYSILKSFCQVIFPLITFPYISRTLLVENVGKINYSNSILSYISLIAALGITTYAVRECARVRDDKQLLENTASQIFSINLITTIAAYSVLIVVLIISKSLTQYRRLIGIMSASIMFGTLGADWLNTAMEDFQYITIRTFLCQFLSLIAMFLFVKEPDDYYKYALITAAASSGANISNMFYRKRFCRLRFTLQIDWKKHFPPILLLFVMILSQTIFCNSDTTILGFFKGDRAVGLYSTSVKVYNLVNTMIASIAWVIMPQMSHAYEVKNRDEINRLFSYATGFIVVLGLPSIVGITMLCPDIILLIAGSEYLPAYISLHILTVALSFSLIGGLIGNIVLIPSQQEKICLKSCIYAAVINAVLNMLLIPRFGLNAAAATTAFAQLIAALVNFKYMDRKIRLENAKGIFLSSVVGSLAIIAVCAIAKRLIVSNTIMVLTAVGSSVVVYGIILLLLKNTFAMELIHNVQRKLKQRSIRNIKR